MTWSQNFLSNWYLNQMAFWRRVLFFLSFGILGREPVKDAPHRQRLHERLPVSFFFLVLRFFSFSFHFFCFHFFSFLRVFISLSLSLFFSLSLSLSLTLLLSLFVFLNGSAIPGDWGEEPAAAGAAKRDPHQQWMRTLDGAGYKPFFSVFIFHL